LIYSIKKGGLSRASLRALYGPYIAAALRSCRCRVACRSFWSSRRLACSFGRDWLPRLASSSATASAGERPFWMRRKTSSRMTLRRHQAVRCLGSGRQRAPHSASNFSTAGPPARPSLYSRQTSPTVRASTSVYAGGRGSRTGSRAGAEVEFESRGKEFEGRSTYR
jgi:hypothetical protein